MSYLKTTKISRICADSTTKAEAESSFGETDRLFGTDPARRAYKEYRKYKFEHQDEASIVSLVWSDTIMKSIFDELRCPKDADASHTLQLQQSASIFASRLAPEVPLNSVNGKCDRGGTKPMNSERTICTHMPPAAC